MDLAGQTVGKFEVLQEIGRGGMSTVYRCRDTALDRVVALKVLDGQIARDEEAVRRFVREARSAARLMHGNVVTIYEVGNEDGRHFIAMEYLEGEDLAQLIRRSGAMPVARVNHVVGQLAGALDYAHRRGFVHRDIKPGNIMVLPDGRAVLMDFGLAKANYSEHLTQFGTIVGTPAYMSPEQIRGEAVGPASDIYSLALVAYQMLTGVVPFEADSFHTVMHAQMHRDPAPLRSVRPDIPEHVEHAVLAALAKDPDQRTVSAGQFAAALRGAQPALPATTAKLNPPQEASRPRLRAGMRVLPLPVLGAVAAVGLMLAVVMLVGWLSSGRQASHVKADAVTMPETGPRETASPAGTVAAPEAPTQRSSPDGGAAPERPVGQVAVLADGPAATSTATATRVPTATSVPTATGRLEPTPSAVAAAPAPVDRIELLSPPDGAETRGWVTLTWRYGGRLAAGEVFDVLACGGEACDLVSKTNTDGDSYLYCPGGEGPYRWQVRIFDGTQHRGEPSSVGRFQYSGGDCGSSGASGGGGSQGGAEPTKTEPPRVPPTARP